MQNADFVQEVIRLTNEYRAQNGLSILSVDIDLTEAAQDHTEDMANDDFFSHIGEDGSRPWDRAQAAGYETGIVGENIGVGYRTPREIVNGWINSPSHRAAMLNPRYNEIGVGFHYLRNDRGRVNYNYYWAQLFGQGEIESTTTGATALTSQLPSNFDALQYGASYADLIATYGFNLTAFAQHYVDYGSKEGRELDRFDEYRYLASYDDLLQAFGDDVEAATEHYVKYGYKEGRQTDMFQPLQYLASHGDLINAYGLNLEAATQHFVKYGHGEQRSHDSFNEDIYIASNPDLIHFLGYALDVATQHYVQYGMSENRSTNSFDPVGYLDNYGDLQAAYGNNLAAATRHYIEYGFREGRTWV